MSDHRLPYDHERDLTATMTSAVYEPKHKKEN